jgi:hypothetical protein
MGGAGDIGHGRRVAQILQSAASGDDAGTPAERLCRASASALAVTGVGLSLASKDGTRSTVCATDPISNDIEDLQVLFGEGPCVDAGTSGRPVLISDLADAVAGQRWPAFSASLLRAGARAVFALPLRVGPLDLGALDLYRDSPGGLADQALATAYADAALRLALEWHGASPEMATAPEHGWVIQSRVHQASGMLMVQMSTDISTAFAVLRAYAFQVDQPLDDVAGGVLTRSIRFDGDAEG